MLISYLRSRSYFKFCVKFHTNFTMYMPAISFTHMHVYMCVYVRIHVCMHTCVCAHIDSISYGHMVCVCVCVAMSVHVRKSCMHI